MHSPFNNMINKQEQISLQGGDLRDNFNNIYTYIRYINSNLQTL